MAGTEYSLPRPIFTDPVKLLVVVAPFYRDIADMMIEGALAEIEAASGTHELVEVPGALEIPTTIAMADRMSNYDGFVALGCVIRGETTHYETVCNDSSRGLTMLGLTGTLVGNGILTVENRDQAVARADPKQMNKGAGAAAAALHLIALSRKWGKPKGGIGFRPDLEEYRLAGDTKGPTTA